MTQGHRCAAALGSAVVLAASLAPALEVKLAHRVGAIARIGQNAGQGRNALVEIDPIVNHAGGAYHFRGDFLLSWQ